MLEEIEEVKIVLLGDTNFGKTSILRAYVYPDTLLDNMKPTGGSASEQKLVEFNGSKYMLNITDTAGQERFRGLVPVYLHGAKAAIIVVDISKDDATNSIEYWVNFVKENTNDIREVILCCNKIDLIDSGESTISIDDLQEKASELNLTFFETSAKTGFGIYKMFEYLISKISAMNDEEEKPVPQQISRGEKGGCC